MNRRLTVISRAEESEADSLQFRQPPGTGQKQSPPRQRMMRVREAAAYLGSSPWKIRQLIANRRIPFMQDGDGPFLLDVRDLDGFIERSKRIV
jgi:excisionase family DNA binding protein